MRLRSLLVTLLLASSGSVTNPASAASTPTLAPGWPPLAYRLDQASVQFDIGAGQVAPSRQIVVTGNGNGRLEQQGRQTSFNIGRDAVLALINGLYAARFFDLPDELQSLRSVFPNDDGTIGTQTLAVHDVPTTTVCFKLPDFGKCVSYRSHPPRELEEVVQRFLNRDELRALTNR